jgi:hypothetical protein
MGAKYVLSRRQQSLAVRAIPVGDANDSVLAAAQQLARFAGFTLDYIDGLTVPQISRDIVAYCPK